MKNISITLILVFVAFQYTAAQFNETIRTGRPGQAIGPFAVGKQILQIQSGFDISGFTNDDINTTGDSYAGNSTFRYGITKTFEINTALEYRNDDYKYTSEKESTNGLSVMNIGTRINFFEGTDHIPAVGLQLTFKLPITAESYRSDYIAPSILLILAKKISNKFAFTGNVGMNYNGNTPIPNGLYVANLSYSISDKWGTFIENYGTFTNKEYEQRWDTGISYLINNNLQLDLHGGIGNNYGVKDYFTSIGVSWRTLTFRTPKTN